MDQRTIDSPMANAMTTKFLQELKAEKIQDERYTRAITRTHSRFTSSITPNEVLALQFHPSGAYLAYGRMDGSLTVWVLQGHSFNKAKNCYIPDANGNDKVINDLSFNPSELNEFATVSNSNEIFIWNIQNDSSPTVNKLRTLSLPSSKVKVNRCAYDPRGIWFFAATKSDCLYIYNVKEEHSMVASLPVHSISDENDTIYSISWDNSGKFIFIGFRSGKLALLEVSDDTGEMTFKLIVQAHRSAISVIKMDPVGRFVITGSTDGSCALWDTSTLTCSLIIDDMEGAVISMDVDHLGKILAVCSTDDLVRFYNINDGTLWKTENMQKFNSELVVRFYPRKSWFILSGENDTLESYCGPVSITDPLLLWKSDYANKLSSLNTRGNNKSHRNLEHPHSDISSRSKSGGNGSSNSKRPYKQEREKMRERERDRSRDRFSVQKPQQRNLPGKPSRFNI